MLNDDDLFARVCRQTCKIFEKRRKSLYGGLATLYGFMRDWWSVIRAQSFLLCLGKMLSVRYTETICSYLVCLDSGHSQPSTLDENMFCNWCLFSFYSDLCAMQKNFALQLSSLKFGEKLWTYFLNALLPILSCAKVKTWKISCRLMKRSG